MLNLQFCEMHSLAKLTEFITIPAVMSDNVDILY